MHSIPNVPDTLAREIYADLCGRLPTPTPDTPQARAVCVERALAFVASLIPENTAEAELATQIVAADAHAQDCIRAASQPGLTPDELRRHRAQAASMMRAMQTGMRLLQRTQMLREKAEAARYPAAMERAGYWFHDVSVDPPPTPPAATKPEPAPGQPPTPQLGRRDFSEMTEAEQYAVLYPDRAALIRASGGLPPDHRFGPPEPEVVDAIIRSDSPILRALDRPSPTEPSQPLA